MIHTTFFRKKNKKGGGVPPKAHFRPISNFKGELQPQNRSPPKIRQIDRYAEWKGGVKEREFKEKGL